jgi:hypothetical protein
MKKKYITPDCSTFVVLLEKGMLAVSDTFQGDYAESKPNDFEWTDEESPWDDDPFEISD